MLFKAKTHSSECSKAQIDSPVRIRRKRTTDSQKAHLVIINYK